MSSNKILEKMLETKSRAILNTLLMSFEQIRQAANKDAQAQFHLGLMYYMGYKISENKNQAKEWFQKAAAQQHTMAQFYLGIVYQQLEESPSEIIKLYANAANQDHEIAHLFLANFLFEEAKKNINSNHELAFLYLEQAIFASQKNMALHTLISEYIFTEGEKQLRNNLKVAANYLILFIKATSNQPDEKPRVLKARLYVGKMYAEHKLTINEDEKVNFREVMKWLKKTAENTDYSQAQSYLMDFIFAKEKNHHTRHNTIELFMCYEQAILASLGHAKLQHRLTKHFYEKANWYDEGKNPTAALIYFKTALSANKGQTKLQSTIVRSLFDKGKKYLKQNNHNIAFNYFEQAVIASEGHEAHRSLLTNFLTERGRIYLHENNHEMAFKYFEQAKLVSKENPKLRAILNEVLFAEAKMNLSNHNYSLALKCFEYFVMASENCNDESIQAMSELTLAEAQHYIGVIYAMDGNSYEAQQWIAKAAEKGYKPAQLYFRTHFFNSSKITSTEELLGAISANMDFAMVISAYADQDFSKIPLSDEDCQNFTNFNKISDGVIEQKATEVQNEFTNHHATRLFIEFGSWSNNGLYKAIADAQKKAFSNEDIIANDNISRLAKQCRVIKESLMHNETFKQSLKIEDNQLLDTIITIILKRALLKMIIDLKATYLQEEKMDITVIAASAATEYALLAFAGPAGLLAIPLKLMTLFGRPTIRNRVLHATGRLANTLSFESLPTFFKRGVKRKLPEETTTETPTMQQQRTKP